MTTIHATAVGTPAVPAPRPPGTLLQLRPLRLQLRSATPSRLADAMVDGAWWPYTDDLISELEPLLADMAERGHLVHRITYSLGAWQPVPRKAHIGGTLVRLGGYRTQSAAAIHLIDSSGTPPLILAVIPPATRAGAAQAALQLAATTTALDAAAVLAATS